MVNKIGLTGIDEVCRGFVGSRPKPAFDFTLDRKPRVKFNIACGITDESLGKFPVWRYCVAVGKPAELLRGIAIGRLVKVTGWLACEAQRDEYYKIVKDEQGNPQTLTYLVVVKAEILEYVKKDKEFQPALIS